MTDIFSGVTTLTNFMDALTGKLDKFFGNLRGSSQQIVDKECTNVSNYINE